MSDKTNPDAADRRNVAVELNVPQAPTWLRDVLPDLHIKVKPLDMAIWSAATAYCRRRAREIAQAHEDVAEAGAVVEPALDLTDPDQLEGLSRQLFAQGLGRNAILAWEGVGEDGKPVEPTPERIDLLLRQGDVGDRFLSRYTALLDQVRDEGNGSGAGPNGTTAAAPDTAKGAGNKASPARKGGKASTGKGARTSKTS